MATHRPSDASYPWRLLPGGPTAGWVLGTLGLALVMLATRNVHPVKLEAQTALAARQLPLWAGLPFAGMLLSIALGPLVVPHFWHRHYGKVAVGWAAVFFAPFLLQYGGFAAVKVVEVLLRDYLPFLLLLWGLYTVSGGILLRAHLVGTPWLNAGLLLAGLVVASLMGTTGASMLLVRPLLRANAWRRHKAHVFVFFIFLVSNIGGLLTPLGDPPLFLGFLHGVPFFWTLRLIPHYLVVSGLVLAIFVAFDLVLIRRETAERPLTVKHQGIKVEGSHNFLLLVGILGAVMLSGLWQTPHFAWLGIEFEYRNLVRDLLIVIIAMVSLATTPRRVRNDNNFSWSAIQEVALLFFGIFVTIIPVLMTLGVGGDGAAGAMLAGVSHPWEYFWLSGALSSVLDNAPTYLTFLALALGSFGIAPEQLGGVLSGAVPVAASAEFARVVAAISAGAVMMGANTYIGNAPNFMVLTIAREHGVRMPSFFGYMLWSTAVLLPVFLLATWIFF